MALLEIKPTKKLTIICTLEESTALQVEQYAAFVTASPDEVVNKALEYTFGKDSEFQKYRVANPNPTGTLRKKKPAPGATGAPRGPKPGGSTTKASATA